MRAGKTPLQSLEAKAAIARFRRQYVTAIRPDPTSLAQFWLPDLNDIHILALAVTQHVDVIVTHNKKTSRRMNCAAMALIAWTLMRFASVAQKAGAGYRRRCSAYYGGGSGGAS